MSRMEYYPGMTQEDVFQSGRDYFKSGEKNIPPYLIAMDRQRSLDYVGNASIWQSGWRFERALSSWKEYLDIIRTSSV